MKKISKILIVVLILGILQIQPVYAASFKDVSSDNTLSTEIDYLVERGLLKGILMVLLSQMNMSQGHR